MHPNNFQCWRILFLLLFLTHIVCVCHLSDLRPCASSSTFSSSGSFDGVPSLSILRMTQNTWTPYEGNCSDVYIFDNISATEFGLEKFSHSSRLLSYFFFRVRLLDWILFQYSQVFVIFLFSKRSESFLIWQFYYFRYLFFFSSRFSSWTWRFFLCQIPFLYPGCTFLLFVSVFLILFHFCKQLYVIHVHKVINLSVWFCKFIASSAFP